MSASDIVLAIPIFFVAFSALQWMTQSRRGVPGILQRRDRGSRFLESAREVSRVFAQNGLNQAILRLRGYRQRLDTLLMRSGYPFEWKAENLLFYKELAMVAALLGLWQMSALPTDDPIDVILWLGAAVLAFWLLDIVLQLRARTRKTEMQKRLPTFVDLMALAVDGGLDFTVAVERICEKMKPGALRQELHVLLQEARLGSSRKEILLRWAHRTALADAQSLASLIIQSEEMGTPLAGVLRNYAEDMRTRRILRAEEVAGKIPVKILFPMMVFFFPVVFVIILGPFALQFLQGAK